MIPKVIHYCWFGGNPLPEDAKKCIASWKKYCPDYEIIQWDESNFDLNYCNYVKEAYAAKKWAFVSDVARLYALVNYGGVYMDTDVEVKKDFSRFLEHKAFSGFEKPDAISTAIMGCEKNFPLFKDLLDEYESRHFLDDDGSYNVMTNVAYITNRCLKAGLKLNNTFQNIEGFVLYPKDFFCPKDYSSGQIMETENTYTIHHFSASWYSEKENAWHRFERKIYAILGVKNGNRLCNSFIVRIIKILYLYGINGILKRIKKYIKGRK